MPVSSAVPNTSPSLPVGSTAVVYCEGQFGEQDGKTANGLVRHSEKYEILSVLDSRHAGADAGQVLDGAANGIPLLASLGEAVAHAGHVPDYLICGLAPADGLLSAAQRVVLLDGIAQGMHIINGLHDFLNDDAEFVAASLLHGVTITDVRRPRDKKDLQLFSGRIFDVTCPRIAVLGTDGAVGKRTTATLLVRALNERGVKAVLVGTGQTTIMQGGKYGVALDALVPQFCSGEVEKQVVAAFEGEDPDVIIVEGQGALSHPAYLTSAHILRGSRPAGVIVQHAPERRVLGDFPMIAMPSVAREVALIESFADTRVIGITVNHEGMADDAAIGRAIDEIELDLGLPATDPLTRPLDQLADMVLDAFPALRESRVDEHAMTAPRLEVDLDAIEANTRSLVDRLAPTGIRVTGVTKAALGSPGLGAAMLRGGATGLGDSRIENLARLETAGLLAPRTLDPFPHDQPGRRGRQTRADQLEHRALGARGPLPGRRPTGDHTRCGPHGRARRPPGGGAGSRPRASGAPRRRAARTHLGRHRHQPRLPERRGAGPGQDGLAVPARRRGRGGRRGHPVGGLRRQLRQSGLGL